MTPEEVEQLLERHWPGYALYTAEYDGRVYRVFLTPFASEKTVSINVHDNSLSGESTVSYEKAIESLASRTPPVIPLPSVLSP